MNSKIMKQTVFVVVASFVAIMFIVFCVGFVTIIYLGLSAASRDAELQRKQTTETDGTLDTYSELTEVSGDPPTPSTRTKLNYTYNVDGKSYSGSCSTSATREQSKKGTSGKVCYEPSNPPNSTFYFTKAPCGR